MLIISTFFTAISTFLIGCFLVAVLSVVKVPLHVGSHPVNHDPKKRWFEQESELAVTFATRVLSVLIDNCRADRLEFFEHKLTGIVRTSKLFI
jgi:hypothetical protein